MNRAFSLLEILVVIAVIGILSALLIPRINDTRQAASMSIARQQQAELQTALGNWIAAQSSGPGGLAAARAAYSGEKLLLLRNYLQDSTYASLTGNGDVVTSAALDSANAYLQFSPWNAGGQPMLQWVNR